MTVPARSTPRDASAPLPKCGARTRAGTPCAREAGWGTDHVGQGKCKLHGGASLRLHGRYSTIQRPRIRELLAEHQAQPDALDTAPEVALMRALTQDYVERYDATMDALVAWHESWRERTELITPEQARALLRVLDEYEELSEGADGLTETQRRDLETARRATDRLRDGDADAPAPAKPVQLPDVADAVRLLAEVTKAVERVERARAASAITRQQLAAFLFALERLLTARIHDPVLLDRLREDILAIQV